MPLADIYAENYIKSVEYAWKRGVRITSNSFRYPGYHYCGALAGFNIALTVDGFLSTCYEVTKYDDSAANAFIVGRVTENGVELFKNKILKMRNLEDLNLSKCVECPYRLVCCGGCPRKKVRKSQDSLNTLIGRQMCYLSIGEKEKAQVDSETFDMVNGLIKKIFVDCLR